MSHLDYIKKLEREIAATQNEILKVQQRQRLSLGKEKYEGEDRMISSEEMAEEIRERPIKKIIPTGLPKLDDMIGGFRGGQLVVLSGPTKHGKTAFAMHLTNVMAAADPAFFPLEAGGDDLIGQFIERGFKVPHFYLPRVNMARKMEWLEERIIESIVKYGTEVVFVDHLHYLTDGMGRDRLDLIIGEIMRRLKNFAQTWDITIVMLCHIKKTKFTEAPSGEDLRDSSFIAQEADTVMMMWRETKKEGGITLNTNNTVLNVLFNRRLGKTGIVQLAFENGSYVEKDWSTTMMASEQANDF